eukprot:scaffold85846_cov40-Cyclotella_meneghiniana.AAC.8
MSRHFATCHDMSQRHDILCPLSSCRDIRQAALSLIDEKCPPVRLACDNIGAVGHGNNRGKSLKDTMVQVDDDKVAWAALRLVQQLKVVADKVAQDYLVRAIHSGRFISSYFPFESSWVIVGRQKCTSSITEALYRSWGREEAKVLLAQRNIVSKENFDLIYWDGMEESMKVYPQVFKVYITKHVSHFQGTNRQLSRDKSQEVDNVCQCCGCKNESTCHITRCPDEGPTVIFYESADLLLDFLHETQMDPRLIDCITQYLEGRATTGAGVTYGPSGDVPAIG